MNCYKYNFPSFALFNLLNILLVVFSTLLCNIFIGNKVTFICTMKRGGGNNFQCYSYFRSLLFPYYCREFFFKFVRLFTVCLFGVYISCILFEKKGILDFFVRIA